MREGAADLSDGTHLHDAATRCPVPPASRGHEFRRKNANCRRTNLTSVGWENGEPGGEVFSDEGQLPRVRRNAHPPC